jgi:SSS family solute:Na+ symporter
VTPIDIAVVAAYFLAVAGISVWSSRHSQEGSSEYFLSGRSVGWLAIGASLFASNISAEHFIGLAGSGKASGLAVGQFEWLACFILLLLGWLFVPLYLRLGVFTMPEFLEHRFDRSCRTYLSGVSLIAYVFTKISVALYATSMVLRTILGWDVYTGAIVMVLATGLYTLIGGLRAVIYTELFQAFVLIGGAALLTWLAVDEVGGFAALGQGVPAEYFNLWKSAEHTDFPWTGILFGAPILGVWYWCTDQMIVQRTLAAKTIADAQRGAIFAGFLKLLPVFIMVLPGLAGRILYPDVKPDQMYATLVNELLPPGLKGLVVAALLAALMSSLSAVYNSASTLVVMDFYKPLRPAASEKELVRAGQAATLILIVAGFAWLPFLGVMSEQLFVYLQSVQAYISPPIAAVFLLGLLWKRVNGAGALAALLTGFVLGAIRFVAEIGVKLDHAWVKTDLIHWYATINFLHVAILLFAVSIGVLVLVSLATPAPAAARLAMFEPHGPSAVPAGDRSARQLNVALSVMLAAVVLGLWALCSPWGIGA